MKIKAPSLIEHACLLTIGLGGSTISGASSVKNENSVASRNRFKEIQRKLLKKITKNTVYSNFVDPWCEGVLSFNRKCSNDNVV